MKINLSGGYFYVKKLPITFYFVYMLLFYLIGNNILKVIVKQTNTFRDYLISDGKEYLVPRVFMRSIAYKI